MKSTCLKIYLCTIVAGLSWFSFAEIGDSLRNIPVQDRGRIKPFDTFAREALLDISGRSSFDQKSSIHVVTTWIIASDYWNQTSFILVKKHQVKKALGLNVSKKHFSPIELANNQNLQKAISELKVKKDRDEELDDYFLEIESIYSRIMLYQWIQKGELPLWFDQDHQWNSANQLSKNRQKQLVQLFQQYSKAILSKDGQVLDSSSQLFKLSHLTNKMNAEVHYNQLNPFRWSWIFYLFGLVFWFALMLYPRYQKYLFLISTIIAFLLNTYGMILRCYIMSRPPVSNMYETLLWVPWASVVLAFILQRIKKIHFPVLMASVVSFVCLFVSDQAFGVLNGKLEPLEAVLRSNFWLSTHVLIITMSYAAFFLAFVMGDFLVLQFLFKKPISVLKNHFWFLIKCLQMGVFLLALGTILGAIWADYSWGRFWGWDPKEVWALVSLLGYLALLHARVQGWVKEWGLAVGSVICFFLVVMAWYGVNFVLGAGLHSYGFGQGGLPYVAVFTLLHFIFLLFVWRYKIHSQS